MLNIKIYDYNHLVNLRPLYNFNISFTSLDYYFFFLIHISSLILNEISLVDIVTIKVYIVIILLSLKDNLSSRLYIFPNLISSFNLNIIGNMIAT